MTGLDSTQSTRPESTHLTHRAVDSTRLDSRRDWVVDLGLAIAGLGAIFASFSALKDLAGLVGWSRLDWLLPVILDTFVITTTRVWMSTRTKSSKVRRFSAANAIGAIVLSLAGNATDHASHAHIVNPHGRYFWLLVVAVSSLPPVAIGLISHLAVLRSRDAEFAALESASPVDLTLESTDSTELADPTPVDRVVLAGPDRESESTQSVDPDQVDPTGGDESTGPDPLLDEARRLDREHRQSTGRHIGADRLREELKIGSSRARLLRDTVRGVHIINGPKEATA